MKLAILGTRGVPPNYGGFETFAAELSTRLVRRGHDVTVYCREAGEPAWNGVRRIVLPAVGHKYLETVSHTFLSAADALRRNFDAVLVCNAANAFVLPMLRAARIPAAINVDGIERRRRKWNLLGRAVYATGETMSVSFASEVIADADVIARYYREQHHATTTVIPYGADFPPGEPDSDVLARLGLRTRGYILYVSRFEPENNPLEVVQAYEKLNDAPPLVMLGKGLYAKELVAELHRHASERILFPGALYGADYRTLQRHALLYVQATEVGGTHPALIEAMASGGAVLAHDTPENREVGGEAVGYFGLRPETLSGTLREWLSDAGLRETYRTRAQQRAAERYSWERVTDAYEALFVRIG
ncbi:MAG TPA: glycosyltransferase [Thermoanaerobaculia bacterium]|jgi:glycosyltransferase involved in cell wall biosynthesis